MPITEAQKRAIYKYMAKNKDKVQEYNKSYLKKYNKKYQQKEKYKAYNRVKMRNAYRFKTECIRLRSILLDP